MTEVCHGLDVTCPSQAHAFIDRPQLMVLVLGTCGDLVGWALAACSELLEAV